jgi:hypothetical protein
VAAKAAAYTKEISKQVIPPCHCQIPQIDNMMVIGGVAFSGHKQLLWYYMR